VSAQNNQLFGYATESEDVVIRRVSRRVTRYLDVLQTLPEQFLAPQKSGLVPPPPPIASHSSAFAADEVPLAEETEREFAEDIPTHVSFVRSEGSAQSTEDTPSVVVPLSVAPISVSLPPLPVLPDVPVKVPLPPAPPKDSSLSGVKPPPVPLKVKTESEILVKAPNPVAPRKSQSPKSAVQPIVSHEAMAASIKSAAVSKVASTHMTHSSPPEAMPSVEDSTFDTPIIALLIASAALLLAGLVYWLLTFDKFVY
jgi:hypothetical protein